MPYIKKFTVSPEGNHYPASEESFVTQEVLSDLMQIESHNSYYQVYELPERQRALTGSYETTDFNRHY